jgi:hypothetical protein
VLSVEMFAALCELSDKGRFVWKHCCLRIDIESAIASTVYSLVGLRAEILDESRVFESIEYIPVELKRSFVWNTI